MSSPSASSSQPELSAPSFLSTIRKRTGPEYATKFSTPRSSSMQPTKQTVEQVAENVNAENISGDSEAVARPSLYRHEPIPRSAPFEKYYGHQPCSVPILDELKSNRLEGVYNLSFLLLAFALVYLFIRSVIETGFLAGPSAICYSSLLRDLRVTLTLALPLPLGFLPSFLLIVSHVRHVLPTRIVITVHSLTLAIFFAICTAAIFRARVNPLSGVACGVVVVIIALKMHSYVMTNLILAEETAKLKREAQDRRSNDVKLNGKSSNTSSPASSNSSNNVAKSAPGVAYPHNVTLSNFVYFIVAPTLVYETGYPRTTSIRGRYVAWYSFQFCLCLALQYILLMQFCVPIWRAAQDTGRLWWYSMKLALPSFIIWLLLFWGFFQCALNIVAELTRFADREFYRDWWNASDLSQFWRLWNVPVHEWCVRHLFVETVSRHNVDVKVAVLSTFVLSAVFHEYICVVGFRMLRPYMFVGMMMQIPLIKWSTKWAGTRTGNYIMWTMLFFGQSWVPLLYCTHYILTNRTLMCQPSL